VLAVWVGAERTSPSMFRGGSLLAALLVGLLVADVVVSPGGTMARVLSPGWLRGVGRISYGLYLWHWPVFLVCTETRLGLGFWPTLVVRVAVTFAAAGLSWRLVERPVLMFKRRFERAASSAAPVSVPVTGAPETVPAAGPDEPAAHV
jgi:peptidoglycan/LPS O-acetylase OafA/YrhL